MKARILPRTAVLAMLIVGSFAMADETGIAWDELDRQQQRVLRSFAENWDELDGERQVRLSTGADRWLQMSPNHLTLWTVAWTAIGPQTADTQSLPAVPRYVARGKETRAR